MKVREEIYEGKHGGAQVKPEAKRPCFCLLGAFKTYDNLLEGKKKDIPRQ
jgi:hypothetical protein